jgi:hypothetical protein
MGIEWTLREVWTVDRAKNVAGADSAGWSAMQHRPLMMELNRPVEVGGGGSTHTSAKADSRARNATSPVGMKVSIRFPSRGVDGGGVR